MNLEDVLRDNRARIVKKWIRVVLGSYPADAQRFFRKERDPFANPVGSTISQQIEKLYDELVKGWDTAKVSSHLDAIVRVRAVQDFKPSQAVGFVLRLKEIIREEWMKQERPEDLSGEVSAFEKKIDDTALLAFDQYSACRQKINDLRVNETKRQVSALLKRESRVRKAPYAEPDQ